MQCRPVPISRWGYTIINGHKVFLAKTICEVRQGLQKVSPHEFQSNDIMIFFNIPPGSYFHTQNCLFTLEITFMDKYNRIISSIIAKPGVSQIGPVPIGTNLVVESRAGWLKSQNLKDKDIISWLFFA